MYEHDTIAAIATPPGQGGVAIIRMSGPQAETIARQVFVFAHPSDHLLSHRFYFGRIVDPLTNRPLDQGLLVLMLAPQSYTGEDVVEIHCHGGNLLSRRILTAVLNQGARLAVPGEFTKRAFLNSRIDLSQAEAVLDLIQAKSDQGLSLAWEQLSGRLSDACTALRERLIALTAYVEAFIDFPEEDIPERTQTELACELQDLSADMEVLGDTAGLRHTMDEVERIGVERAKSGLKEAELVLAVFDASRPLDDEDEIVCTAIATKRVIPVLNKIDLPVVVSPADLEDRLQAGSLVRLSAKSGIGMENLVERIQQAVLGTEFACRQEQTGGVIVSRVRHRDSLAKARQSLGQASTGLKEGLPFDLVSVDLRVALDHIGEITGHVSTEDILDRVFREFCIGK